MGNQALIEPVDAAYKVARTRIYKPGNFVDAKELVRMLVLEGFTGKLTINFSQGGLQGATAEDGARVG